MSTKISDHLAVKLGQKALLVESRFDGTIYAIDKGGKGMWLLSGGAEIPIAAEHVEEFINELRDVWSIYKR